MKISPILLLAAALAPSAPRYYIDQESPKTNAGIMCVYDGVQQQVFTDSAGKLAGLELAFYVYQPGTVRVRIRSGLAPDWGAPILWGGRVTLSADNEWVPWNFDLRGAGLAVGRDEPLIIEVCGTDGNIQMVRGNLQYDLNLPPHYKHELYSRAYGQYGVNWRMGFELWMEETPSGG